jgi:phosphoesterase RecJ-like protein
MTDTVKKLAPEILSLINGSKNILLHLHPSPDPDSVGSALAMKFALESLGKKATIIAGDSKVPEAFSHFPGFAGIVAKNFFEINLAEFDLFIIQDAGSLGMISRKGENGAPVVFPDSLKTVSIDHHISNEKFAHNINLVDATYPATALILFDLFKEWEIKVTQEIAENLFIGTYTDTGGFRYRGTTPATLAAAAELAQIAPDFSDVIFKMENNHRPQAIVFQGLALSNIETFKVASFPDSYVAIAPVALADIKAKGISAEDTNTGYISSILKSAIGWDVGVGLIELPDGKVKASFRTRNPARYDLSVIAKSVGGGGHKAAAGAVIVGTIAEAKQKIVEAVKAVL